MRVLRAAPRWNVLGWCAACALLCAGCVGAAHTGGVERPVAHGGDPALPVPFDLQEAVERATILGTNLFLLDAATARARQALAREVGPIEAGRVGHYLALMGDDGSGRLDGSVQVLFFTEDQVPTLIYRVLVRADAARTAVVTAQDPPGVVHEPLMTLLSARQLALGAVPRTQQALSTVLMPQRSGQIVVYLLAATEEPNVAVLGRHYRVEVAEDGAAVDRVTALADAELELPTRDREGHRLAALAITQGGLEHPTETHVFASRVANLPIYITTDRGRWKVQPAGIDYLGPR